MSTSIQIIPTSTIDITFGQVLNTSEGHMNRYLKTIGLTRTIKLNVSIHDINEKYVHNVDLTNKFSWKDNEYAWFTIGGIEGGTDAHFEQIYDKEIDPENPWWKLEYIEQNNRTIKDIKDKFAKSMQLDRLWYFRRSVGQTETTVWSYGLISASVAELSKGILWSDDGAWQPENFPTESGDFLNRYFQLDHVNSEEEGNCLRDSIESIKKELS
jgi:hypothetical protein